MPWAFVCQESVQGGANLSSMAESCTMQPQEESGGEAFKVEFCLQLFGFNVRQQTDCGILEEVEHVVEIFGAAIVGVGDGGGVMVAEEVGHQEQAGCGSGGGSAALELAHIVEVHADDIVEAREVGFLDRARTMSEAIAAAGGVSAHTRVGEFAFVVVDEARLLNVEGCGQAALGHQLAKYFLGSRGAADVAETDE